jgi:hypothetical protein
MSSTRRILGIACSRTQLRNSTSLSFAPNAMIAAYQFLEHVDDVDAVLTSLREHIVDSTHAEPGSSQGPA